MRDVDVASSVRALMLDVRRVGKFIAEFSHHLCILMDVSL